MSTNLPSWISFKTFSLTPQLSEVPDYILPKDPLFYHQFLFLWNPACFKAVCLLNQIIIPTRTEIAFVIAIVHHLCPQQFISFQMLMSLNICWIVQWMNEVTTFSVASNKIQRQDVMSQTMLHYSLILKPQKYLENKVSPNWIS
jgi:hypothetical protein